MDPLEPTASNLPATQDVSVEGFSKALKGLPIRVEITQRHPESGRKIVMLLGFRRMKDGEATRLQEQNALRLAGGQDITVADMIDTLAPLFVDARGIGDFPSAAIGSPEVRFRTYFGGDGSELPEDLEVEGKIVQAAYLGFLSGAFRLVPSELVEAISLLQRGHAEDGEVASN